MQFITGWCPECKTQLYFPDDDTPIECTKCAQHRERKHLLDVKPITDFSLAIRTLLQNIIVKTQTLNVPKKSSDSIKVSGLSNYACKLISPLLTKYGLDKGSQEVKLLREMGQGDTFNCAILSDRAFMIEEHNLLVTGYGRDDAAAVYLQDTLEEISKVNEHEERLVPIHADGDGHCLLHAVSRALVGRELFWHPLMTNLKLHLTERQTDYKPLLQDFIEDSEWEDIIEEADPNFLPSNGESHGLRNIHVFGLSNVLLRPIILMDSLNGMQSKGDYSAVFLPALMPPEQCQNNDGSMHKPIVISWSSKGRNHFIPLVGIQNKPLPKFPKYLLPKLWALPQSLLYKYIQFDNNTCIIGGNKVIKEQYLLKLVSAMEKHFQMLNGVAPSVVTDVYHYLFQQSGIAGISTKMVTEAANLMVKEERLYKCLQCETVLEETLPFLLALLQPGGTLYEIAKQTHGSLKDGYQYKFPLHNNIVCRYNQSKDRLMYVQDYESFKCKHCQGSLRLMKTDGSLVYFNGDELPSIASKNSRCECGHKHYWDGKEYDNLPQNIPVVVEWNGVIKYDYIHWFQYEVNEGLNSNAFELAQNVVQKHFPGEFGSERVVQKVVEQIFNVVVKYEPEEKLKSPNVDTPSKIILTGAKSKAIHKEELTASKSEQALRKKIEQGAVVKQKRTSPVKHSLQNIENTHKKPMEMRSESVPLHNLKEKVNTQRQIRICVEDQGFEIFPLLDSTTTDDIAVFIQEKFHIEKELQIIKYGFPPKTLEQPVDKNEPVSLKHGEKLVVHRKKVLKQDVENRMEIDFNETNDGVNINNTKEMMTQSLTTSLFSLLENVDLWEWACTQRHMFQKDGMFYKQAFKDLGLLTDNQHLSLPCFPNKLFSYSQNKDEFFLCLGETHIHVQVLTVAELNIANQQSKPNVNAMSHPAKEKAYFQKQDELLRRPLSPINASHSNIIAFSGAGHSMVNDSVERIVTTDNEIVKETLESEAMKEVSLERIDVSSNNEAEIVDLNPVLIKTDKQAIEVSTNNLEKEALKEVSVNNLFDNDNAIVIDGIDSTESAK